MKLDSAGSFRDRLPRWFLSAFVITLIVATWSVGAIALADDSPQEPGLVRTLTGHWHDVWCVAFSPDGKTLASAGEDHFIKLWDVFTGECIRTLKGHSGAVRSVAFNARGTRLVSGSEDMTVRLWDPATAENLATLTGHTGGVISVAFNPDGTRIASGGGEGDHTIRLWSVPGRREVAVLKGHTARVWSVAFSPDGKTLASGSADKSVRLWDLASARSTATLAGHTDGVACVKYSPDGKTVASGSMDQSIKLWDVASSSLSTTLETLGKHGLPSHYSYSQLMSIAYSPDGKTLVFGGENGEMELFDVASRKPICVFWSIGGNSRISATAFSPDGKLIATGAPGTIKLWDVALIRRRGMADVERLFAEARPQQSPRRIREEPSADHPTNPAIRARLKLAGPPEKVVELDLSNADLSDADLVCLTKLPNLEKLSIAGNHVTCKGTAYLAALPKLRSLDVARTGVCLDSLLAIKSLEEFDLADLIPTAPYLRALSGLPNLHELNLGINCNVQDSTLAAIEGLSGLRKLRLGFDPSVSDAGLAHLAGLKQLEELDLGSPDVTGSGLEILVGLPKLRRISFACALSNKITDDSLEHLKGLREIESLDLSFCRISNSGLKHLEGLPRLRELNLYATDIGDAGLGALKGMRQLRKLNLGGTKITSDGVETIGELTSLEELDLGRTNITQAVRVRKISPPSDDPFDSPPSPGPYIQEVGSRPALAHLKQLVRLRKLGLAAVHWFAGDGLDQLASLPQLSELDLSENSIGAAGQKQLLTLPHLERLVGERIGLDAARFDLRNLKGLRELDMRYSALSFRPGRQLPNLRKLRLSAGRGFAGNGIGLGPLAQLSALRELELNSSYLDNAGILQQTGLGQVETLVLDAPNVTDNGVKFLDGWKNLKELTLRCQLDDAGIAPIAGLTQLRKLTIANTWITDAGLKKLAPLQNLRRLDITCTACTPAGAEALQSALPDCEIISGGRAPPPPRQFAIPDGWIQ